MFHLLDDWFFTVTHQLLNQNIRPCGLVATFAKAVFGPALVAAVLSTTYCVWSVFTFGGIAEGVAFFRGQALTAREPVLKAYGIAPGGRASGVFHLTNLTDRALTVIGATPDCACVSVAGMPIEIGPSRTVPIKVGFPVPLRGAESEVTHRLVLHLNVDSPPVVLTLIAQMRH